MAITADHIKDKLIKELAAVHVDVEDTSQNRCAASFKVLVRHRYNTVCVCSYQSVVYFLILWNSL
uniref:BolA family member 2 n=1 Tax=Labrus bergylta TaxID=56723 RepID=A0A3Q3GNU6_9LABR